MGHTIDVADGQLVQKTQDGSAYLKRLPSEYIPGPFLSDHTACRRAFRPAYFEQMLAHMDMDDKLMFATDYPHWDFDSPDQALSHVSDREVKKQIMAENARELYTWTKREVFMSEQTLKQRIRNGEIVNSIACQWILKRRTNRYSGTTRM